MISLREFIDVKGGKRLPKGEKLTSSRTNHPYIRITDIEDGKINEEQLMFVPNEIFPRIRRYTVSKGDLFLSIVGTVGLVSMIPSSLDGASLTENAVRIQTTSEQLNLRFLYYVLAGKLGQSEIKRQVVGTTQKKLAIKRIYDIRIPFLPRKVQDSIVYIMDCLENKRFFNQQINRNLLKVCRLQFDKIKQACSETTELSNIATLIMGQSPKGDTYNQNKEGTPLLNGAADFRGGINPSKYTSDPKKVTEPGDYVFGVRATIGLTTKVFNRYAIGRGTGLARALSYESDELLYFIMEDAFNYFARTSTGSVYLNISRREFETYAAPDFSNSVIREFHEFASPLMQQIYQNREQNRELTQLRELLLPRLLAGDIDLSNIEAVMNNA